MTSSRSFFLATIAASLLAMPALAADEGRAKAAGSFALDVAGQDKGQLKSVEANRPASGQGMNAQNSGKSLNPNTGENELKNDLSNMRKKSEAAAAKHEADNASKGLQGNGMQIGKGSAASADNPLNKSAADEYKHIKDQQEAAKQKKQQEALGKAMPAMACKQECTKKYSSNYPGGMDGGWSGAGAALDSIDDTPEEKAQKAAAKKKAEDKAKADEEKAAAEKEQKIQACIKECIAKK